MGALSSSCFPLRPGLAACDETVATTPRQHYWLPQQTPCSPCAMGSWGAVGLHLGFAKLLITSKMTHDTEILTGTAPGAAALAPPRRPHMQRREEIPQSAEELIARDGRARHRQLAPGGGSAPRPAGALAEDHIVPTPQRGPLARAVGRCHVVSQLLVLGPEPRVLGMQFVDRREQLARLH